MYFIGCLPMSGKWQVTSGKKRTRWPGHLPLATIESAAGHGADDHEGFFADDDLEGEGGIGRFVGEVLLAGEEADEGATTQCAVVADGAAQHRVGGLGRVESRA